PVGGRREVDVDHGEEVVVFGVGVDRVDVEVLLWPGEALHPGREADLRDGGPRGGDDGEEREEKSPVRHETPPGCPDRSTRAIITPLSGARPLPLGTRSEARDARGGDHHEPIGAVRETVGPRSARDAPLCRYVALATP